MLSLKITCSLLVLRLQVHCVRLPLQSACARYWAILHASGSGFFLGMEDGIDEELRLLEGDHADLTFEGGGLGDQPEPGVWNLLSEAAFQEQPSLDVIDNESEGSAAERNWYRQAQQDSVSLHSTSVHRSSDHWSFVESGSSAHHGRAAVAVSSEGCQQALSSAFRAVPCRPQLTLPWEAGLWGTVFRSKGPTDWATSESFTFYRPVQPQASPLRGLQQSASGQESHRGAIVLYCFCVKRLRCRNRQPNCLKPLLL